MDDIKIEKIRKAMKLAVDKITKNVYNLSYFNAINYNKNATNLKKVVVSDEKLLSANQLAIYDSFSNTIIVDLMEITNNITEEQLALLLLHELVHMMSADRELNKIGYNDNGLPWFIMRRVLSG